MGRNTLAGHIPRLGNLGHTFHQRFGGHDKQLGHLLLERHGADALVHGSTRGGCGVFGILTVTSAFAAAHPNSLALLSLINPISEPALEGSQRVASRLASLYYRAGAALPEKIGYPLLRSQLITRASSEVMMRTKDKAMRRFINGQHAAYFGSFGSRRGVLSAYEASITHTAAEYAAAIRVPVQMLVAEDDDLGTPETARAMYATLTSRDLPDSRNLPASSSGARERLDMIPEVGHLIHYETPHLAAELIADFAAGHSGNEK